jgi:hypothetical protein
MHVQLPVAATICAWQHGRSLNCKLRCCCCCEPLGQMSLRPLSRRHPPTCAQQHCGCQPGCHHCCCWGLVAAVAATDRPALHVAPATAEGPGDCIVLRPTAHCCPAAVLRCCVPQHVACWVKRLQCRCSAKTLGYWWSYTADLDQ